MVCFSQVVHVVNIVQSCGSFHLMHDWLLFYSTVGVSPVKSVQLNAGLKPDKGSLHCFHLELLAPRAYFAMSSVKANVGGQ